MKNDARSILVMAMILAGAAVSMAAAAGPSRHVAVRDFDLRDVALLPGPFKHAQELDRKYLLSLEPDRLLHVFRLTAGIESKAQPLGGWEAPKCELRGHFVGHYLSACALMYRATGDEQLKKNADAVVAGLAECQAKFPSGYLSAFPESLIDRVEAAKPVWAPWYTLHKIYAGLLDMNQLTGNQQALEVLAKAVGWIKSRGEKLTDEQYQKMLANEHGGMNDVLANLYGVTKNPEHLKLAQRFNHRAVLDPLINKQDKLTGLHANTQFPKVIGLARQYELTGDAACRTAAEFFWNVVTRERSYVTGSNSDNEHFSPKERMSKAFGPATAETCNTYNMLKLTRQLFSWEPRADYSDYYERALYNHILASQNPTSGAMLYYLPLRAGSPRGGIGPHGFGGTHDAFWCCTGTGVENHAKYGDSIYFHAPQDLYVSLFIASELNWKDKGVKIRQETRYPEEPSTKLTIQCAQATPFKLHIRHPYWATKGLQVRVNSKEEAIAGKPGTFVAIDRTWKDGDTVSIEMPMSLRIEPFNDDPNRFAILYGPLVLCAQTELRNQTACALTERDQALDTVKPVAEKPLTFSGSGQVFRRSFAEQSGGDVTFVPFYREFEKPYIVYWDALSAGQWQKKLEEEKARLAREAELKAMTIDLIHFNPDAEKAHQLKSEKSGSGEFGARRYRDARGGWFSFEMKVSADAPMQLMCMYWGSDHSRNFDVLVDGTKIATEKLQYNRPGEFFDVKYTLASELTKGKERITVKFAAHPNSIAGGVFEVRTIKTK